MQVGAYRGYCSGYDGGVQSGDEESGLDSHKVSIRSQHVNQDFTISLLREICLPEAFGRPVPPIVLT